MPNPNLPIGGDYNVYIGARYVPLVMGAWSATVNYEPLSIVTFEGNSYTSKTFVPAGTPVSNKTYWAATGNYNAQVELYRQEVQQISENVANQLEAYNFKMNYLTPSQRHILFIGDSFLVDSPNWATIAASNMQIPTTNYDIIAAGGYGIGANRNILSILTAWVEENSSKLSSYTDVITLLGSNDIGVPNLPQNVSSYYNYLKAKFPQARLYLGMNGFPRKTSTITLQIITTAKEYHDNWIPLGGFWLPNMSSCLMAGNTLKDDAVHPNLTGQTYMGNMLSDILTTGSYSFNISQDLSFKDDTYPATITTAKFKINLTPHILHYEVSLIAEYNTPTSFNGNLKFNSMLPIAAPPFPTQACIGNASVSYATDPTTSHLAVFNYANLQPQVWIPQFGTKDIKVLNFNANGWITNIPQ